MNRSVDCAKSMARQAARIAPEIALDARYELGGAIRESFAFARGSVCLLLRRSSGCLGREVARIRKLQPCREGIARE